MNRAHSQPGVGDFFQELPVTGVEGTEPARDADQPVEAHALV